MTELLAVLLLIFLVVLAIKASVKSLDFMYEYAFTIAVIVIIGAVLLI